MQCLECNLCEKESRVLEPPAVSEGATAVATVATCSGCGNFAVVGFSDGRLHKFNLQSGIHRGQFTRSVSKKQSCLAEGLAKDSSAHKDSVCGVAILNSSIVVSASSGEEVSYKVFSFPDTAQPFAPLKEIQWDGHVNSGLLFGPLGFAHAPVAEYRGRTT